MIPFTLLPGGIVEARFADAERQVLRSLALQVVTLLESRTEAQGDPAIVRLLPAGYREDDEAAEEFRRYTESELAQSKTANARTVVASLDSDPSLLDAADWNAWLRTLTDIRLALAARLGIEHDEDEGDLSTEDGRAMRDVYDWVGYVQEALLRTLP